MPTYYYGLWLFAFGVVLINSRFIYRSIDNEEGDDDTYYPNYYYLGHGHRLSNFEEDLNHLLASELYDYESNDDPLSSERGRKSIKKGDPREFIG